MWAALGVRLLKMLSRFSQLCQLFFRQLAARLRPVKHPVQDLDRVLVRLLFCPSWRPEMPLDDLAHELAHVDIR